MERIRFSFISAWRNNCHAYYCMKVKIFEICTQVWARLAYNISDIFYCFPIKNWRKKWCFETIISNKIRLDPYIFILVSSHSKSSDDEVFFLYDLTFVAQNWRFFYHCTLKGESFFALYKGGVTFSKYDNYFLTKRRAFVKKCFNLFFRRFKGRNFNFQT